MSKAKLNDIASKFEKATAEAETKKKSAPKNKADSSKCGSCGQSLPQDSSK